jgi:hypothetical protein
MAFISNLLLSERKLLRGYAGNLPGDSKTALNFKGLEEVTYPFWYAPASFASSFGKAFGLSNSYELSQNQIYSEIVSS